jgi:serine/threonine protein kinase
MVNRTKQIKKLTTKRKRTRRLIKGGRVIASGAYGCVFNPALKCANAAKRESNKISKLMMEAVADAEYNKIMSIKDKLNIIPNYSDYFLIDDITICHPSKLQTTDLADYTQKCTALAKNEITRTNINTVLDNIKTLNMKNGGLQLDDFIYENGSFQNIYKTHNGLVKLLKKGIMLMNKQNIYHCDIKDSNILVDNTDPEWKLRLIDWGLATEYLPFVDYPFPSSWRNRPLQFNVPFSVIIFTDKFYEKYTKFIKEGGEPTEAQLKPFVNEYIVYWMKERGEGHFNFINQIMTLLFINDIEPDDPEKDPEVFKKEYTMTYIIDYIVDVLVHFTNFKEDGNLNLRVYMDNVFIKIVDIWGFITSYYYIIQLLSNSYSSLSKTHLKIFKQLQFLFVEYLYNPRHEPIDMKTLFSDLKILGQLLHISIHGTLDTYVSPVSSSKSKSSSKSSSKSKTPETIMPEPDKDKTTKEETI